MIKMTASKMQVSSPGLFELVGCRLYFGCQVRAERLFPGDLVEQLRFSRTQEFRQLGLKFLDSFDRHIIHIAVLNRPDQGHLSLDSDWAVLGLLENFHNTFAAIDLRLRFCVEFRAKLREGRQLAKLCEISLQLTRDLLHGFELRCGADP